VVVKLYYIYTQFSRNVLLSHRGIVIFSAHRDIFDYCALNTLNYLLTDEFLVDKYLWQFYEKLMRTKFFMRRPRVL